MNEKGQILVLSLVMMVGCVIGFFIGVQHEKTAAFERAVAQSEIDRVHHASIANPQSSNKEMLRYDMTIVVPLTRSNATVRAHKDKVLSRSEWALRMAVENEDADTVNPHLPEQASFARELASAGVRHHK